MTYDPYAFAVPAPAFELRSRGFQDGDPLPASCYADAGNASPDLIWGALPDGTQSIVLTAFDADAPIPGGLWHWVIVDIAASDSGLPANAGQQDSTLPGAAHHLPNDLGEQRYAGVQPPPGTGTHRLFICATALDVPELVTPVGASTALVNILLIPHTLGRAILKATSIASS